MLRRRLPHAQPLTDRLQRLRDQLQSRPPVAPDPDPSLRWAAVALVFVPSPDSLLLIRRADRPDDPWSGHMALPGGRADATDVDLVATAIREVEEEVGILLEREQSAGFLGDVVPRTPTLPPVAVRPCLFLLSSTPTVALNSEVSAARWVPVDHLLDPGTYRSVELELRGERRSFPAFHLEDAYVWGMTERILSALLEEFRQSES